MTLASSSPQTVSFTPLSCTRFGIEHLEVGGREITRKVSVDPYRVERIGIALVSTGFELDTAATVQHDDGGTLSDLIRRVTGERNAFVVRLHTEILGCLGIGGTTY